MKNAPKERLYQANRYDKDLRLCSSSLLKILDDKQKLWSWFYSSSVKKILVDLHGKKLNFALKSFKNPQDLHYAMQMHQLVKDAKLPTWNTYRHLEGTNDVLMTLGNADGSLVFSPHNESKDRKKAKSDQIFETLGDKEAFFEQAFSILVQSAENTILLPWDSYFLKLKNWETSLLIWDFDQISLWKREQSLQERLEQNIKEFFGFLSGISDYFKVEYREEFFRTLKKKQKEWNIALAGIDLESLYQWSKFIRED